MRAFRSHLKRQEQGRRKKSCLATALQSPLVRRNGGVGTRHRAHRVPRSTSRGPDRRPGSVGGPFLCGHGQVPERQRVPPRPPSKPAEATQRYGKPVPDLEKIKTWANVLNDKQYGYGTGCICPSIDCKESPRHDSLRTHHQPQSGPDLSHRIVQRTRILEFLCLHCVGRTQATIGRQRAGRGQAYGLPPRRYCLLARIYGATVGQRVALAQGSSTSTTQLLALRPSETPL